MTPKAESALVWQASRYLMGDLSVADRLAFEASMADDPAACEALAEAVSLYASIMAARPQASAAMVRQERHGDRPKRWGAVVSVALSLVFLIVLAHATAPSLQREELEAASFSAESGELALAWACVKGDTVHHPDFVETESAAGVDELNMVLGDGDPDEEIAGRPSSKWLAFAGDDDVGPPDWLITAARVANDREGAADAP